MTEETLPRETTAEEVKACILATGLPFITDHECALCDHPVGYRIIEERPFFDSNCNCCVHNDDLQPRTWQDIADTVNMQTNATARYNVAKRFHLDLDKPFDGGA